MERSNHLSDNLKAYQNAKRKTLAEFSKEIGIAKSTICSVMVDGNTTLDTLVRIANALNVSLDELVFGELPAEYQNVVQHFLKDVGWFIELTPEKQKKFQYHLCEILKVLNYDN